MLPHIARDLGLADNANLPAKQPTFCCNGELFEEVLFYEHGKNFGAGCVGPYEVVIVYDVVGDFVGKDIGRNILEVDIDGTLLKYIP